MVFTVPAVLVGREGKAGLRLEENEGDTALQVHPRDPRGAGGSSRQEVC